MGGRQLKWFQKLCSHVHMNTGACVYNTDWPSIGDAWGLVGDCAIDRGGAALNRPTEQRTKPLNQRNQPEPTNCDPTTN